MGTGTAKKMIDLAKSKEKFLGAAHTSEASLLTFLRSGRSVTLLNEVVQTLCSRDGDMFCCA